jgi:hypothetical protein
MFLDSLAEAYEGLGDPLRAGGYWSEISQFAPRESWSGDIYARSFYKKAKCLEERWQDISTGSLRLGAIENYKKFLSLWGDADPIFPEVEDARKRLAKLQSQD